MAGTEAGLRRFLHGLPGVDQVGLERRSATLATRSIKAASKLQALDLAISMIDLTTLEGADTPGKVRSLCAQARRPDPDHPEVPPVAAVCIYPDLVPVAVEALHGSPVAVAAVATAFPSGRSSREVKLADTALAVDGRGRRDRHGDRPRRVPDRPLRRGVRGDRGRPGGLRPRAATGRTSRSSWRPASSAATTRCAGPAGWPCWPAPT